MDQFYFQIIVIYKVSVPYWGVIVTILGKTGNYRCNNIITKIVLLLTLDLILNFWKIYISDNNRKLLDNVYLRLLNSHPFCFLHFHIHNFVFWELGCKRNISMQLFLRVKIDLRHISVQEDGEPRNGVSCKRIQCKFLLKIMVTIKFSSNLMVKVVQKSRFDESWQKKFRSIWSTSMLVKNRHLTLSCKGHFYP